MTIKEALKYASTLEKQRQYNEALNVYLQVIKVEPQHYLHYNGAAVVLYKLSRFKDAALFFEKAIACNKNYAEAYSNLGAIHAKFKNYTKAISLYEKAIALKPSYAGAYTNLGNSLNKIHEYEQAVYFHLRAIRLDSSAANHFSNCASAYKNLGRFDKAEFFYEKAIGLNSMHVNAHFDLATILLQTGTYERGWREYEWRFKKDEMQGHIQTYKAIFSQPFWQGESLANKTILLHSEQGFGDSIQMIRYVNHLKKLGAKIVVYVREGLETLFKSMKAINIVQTRGEIPHDFDYHLPMMSLAYRLDASLSCVNEYYPYLKAPKKNIAIAKKVKKVRVGLCWGASNTGESYEKKVLKLEGFRKLLEHDEVECISLQLGDDAKQIEKFQNTISDVSEHMQDFYATASLIKQCDIIISSDTSVAHLAGAMGKTCWVLLQKVPDWRWGVEGSSTVWYPSVRLFRQYSLGSWSDVYERVYEAFEKEFL